MKQVGVFFLLLLCLGSWLETVVGGCGGGTGAECPVKATDFKQRPTSTYICEPGTEPSARNNYCLRDDIAVYRTNKRLNVIANGCPGHKYFVHDKLNQKFSISGSNLSYSCSSCGSGGCSSCSTGGCSSCGSGGCSSCSTGGCSSCNSSNSSRRLCLSSCATSATPANPYIPRFQEYQFGLPPSPKVSSDGPFTLLQAFPSEADKYPIGFAINGILIVSEHYNETADGLASVPMVKDFDNCGGHGDRANRYHYHGPPVCLLLSMGGTTPASGAQFLYENTSQSQVALWPVIGKPSPLIGFALDGFPIYGPYNVSGDLQVAGSSDLDECLFSAKHQRYHFTANAPFSPPCLVGNLGDFSSKQVNEGICPVVDSAFCSGDKCQPVSLDCEYVPKGFVFGTHEYAHVAYSVILVLWFTSIKISKYIHPKECYYPFDNVILSILPATLFLLGNQLLYKAYYGVDRSDMGNFDLDIEAININLSGGSNSFLCVTGLLYSLITTQVLLMTNDKLKKIQDSLCDELSGCRQVVLCLQAIHADTDAAIQLKKESIDVVIWYLGTLIKQWGIVNISTKEEMQPLDMLYGVLSSVNKLCQEDTKSDFNMQVADRIMDSMNSISVAKYLRCSLEEQQLPVLLWVLQYFIASAMFLGVLLIRSGSDDLNLGMCYVTTSLIGVSTLVIADMDLPYYGFIKVKINSVIDLFDYLSGVVQCGGKDKTNIGKQTVAFFASADARRSSMANVEASIAAKFGHHSNRTRVSMSTTEGNAQHRVYPDSSNELHDMSVTEEEQQGNICMIQQSDGMMQHTSTVARLMATNALAKEKEKEQQKTTSALQEATQRANMAEATAAFYYLQLKGIAVLKGDDMTQHLATAKRMMATDALAKDKNSDSDRDSDSGCSSEDESEDI